jgi:BMFP domain-containing protein YqiC
MKLLLSPDAPTERGADYTDAFAGIDAIEGQGLDNPMGSASPAPAPVAPEAPTPTPTPEPQAATPAAPQKNDDLFNLDKLVTPKTETPAAPAKAPEPAKPEPASLKQFREQYEMTKKERDDFAAKVSELERAKSEGTRKEVEEATKALKAEMDSIRKNAEELDTEVRYLNYTRSGEYKQKYETPLREAWQTALGDIEGIRVTDEDGTERDANHQDIMALLNVPVAKAAIIAQETFGPAAPEIMAHRRRLIELTQARDKSIAEWKEKGAQREVESKKQLESRQTRSRDLFESQFADYEKTHSQLFGREEGDEDGNKLLDESDRLVRIALKGEGIDADMGYDDKVDLITKAQAQVALRARAYGRERLRVIRLQQKVAELEKKVGKVRSSEPGQGEGTSTATRVSPKNAEDAIDELPSAY